MAPTSKSRHWVILSIKMSSAAAGRAKGLLLEARRVVTFQGAGEGSGGREGCSACFVYCVLHSSYTFTLKQGRVR